MWRTLKMELRLILAGSVRDRGIVGRACPAWRGCRCWAGWSRCAGSRRRPPRWGPAAPPAAAGCCACRGRGGGGWGPRSSWWSPAQSAPGAATPRAAASSGRRRRSDTEYGIITYSSHYQQQLCTSDIQLTPMRKKSSTNILYVWITETEGGAQLEFWTGTIILLECLVLCVYWDEYSIICSPHKASRVLWRALAPWQGRGWGHSQGGWLWWGGNTGTGADTCPAGTTPLRSLNQ